MPSTITRIAVKNGDQVKKGDVLLVIEAMKMEVGCCDFYFTNSI